MNALFKIKVFEVPWVILGVQNRPDEAPRENQKNTSKKLEQQEARRRTTRTTKGVKIRQTRDHKTKKPEGLSCSGSVHTPKPGASQLCRVDLEPQKVTQ